MKNTRSELTRDLLTMTGILVLAGLGAAASLVSCQAPPIVQGGSPVNLTVSIDGKDVNVSSTEKKASASPSTNIAPTTESAIVQPPMVSPDPEPEKEDAEVPPPPEPKIETPPEEIKVTPPQP